MSSPKDLSTQKSPDLEQNLITPAALGYRMSAEWEVHEGTWLAWPKNPITWPKKVHEVEDTFARMIEILSQHEKVFLLVDDEPSEKRVRKKLAPRKILDKNLIIHQIPTVDAWIRDYGPIFLVRLHESKRELAYTDWIFNAWGGKYKSSIADDVIPQHIKPILKVPVFETGIVLEGGSIDVNGQGACLTTEQCLLAKTRNPHLGRQEIESYLKNYLGISHIIWLGEGLVGDDTDGHVDDIARFVSRDTVVCALEEDTSDENYKPLKDNFERLQSATDEKGRKLDIVPLPMPGKVAGPSGRLPASYANFYIGNGVVLVPIFKHRNDQKALKILKELFPKREVVGIDCRSLVLGLGAIHCVTQQQPKV